MSGMVVSRDDANSLALSGSSTMTASPFSAHHAGRKSRAFSICEMCLGGWYCDNPDASAMSFEQLNMCMRFMR